MGLPRKCRREKVQSSPAPWGDKKEAEQRSLGVRREAKGAVSGQQVSRRRERTNMSADAGYRSDKLGTENRQLDLQFEGHWWSR